MAPVFLWLIERFLSIEVRRDRNDRQCVALRGYQNVPRRHHAHASVE
ncbi:Uncharacterised protein [Vibrio cholerae]|nr:Uncharacterised protein [Vibrio cholerae]CSI32445.1 Uncharacterised protein [Vibrio cholerae]